MRWSPVVIPDSFTGYVWGIEDKDFDALKTRKLLNIPMNSFTVGLIVKGYINGEDADVESLMLHEAIDNDATAVFLQLENIGYWVNMHGYYSRISDRQIIVIVSFIDK